MTNKCEIRLSGYGGQGIILAGFIVGQAASVYEKKHAIFIQNYGPEARGGACRADIIISDEPILYPYIVKPSTLVAMSQEAYNKCIQDVSPDTIVIIEEDLVAPSQDIKAPILMPAMKIAEKLERTATANVVMLGFLTAITNALSIDAMKQSILASIPKGTEKINTDAFEQGYAAGQKFKAIK